ncbi:hypothetical protein MLD38_028812 [Melastoma candidum]|uniref:Uncharacterized protein n=1 Tax=Melastoma candidum TaxID=119954 RepID=A0ACB9N281_9MYRT|nr:hypothetical protein MLD38_028812 [Melastoma candidum]
MGVPAGFKLNTELTAVLGTFSLNVIQVWSILWGFVHCCSVHIIVGVAAVGILFGVTALAAILIDIFVAVTFHISALHWLIAHLYSIEIEALAGLWRLFRGQKWNPPRLRLDNYDYTVKQHVDKYFYRIIEAFFLGSLGVKLPQQLMVLSHRKEDVS